MKTTNMYKMFLLLLVAVITASSTAFSTNLPDYKVRETYEFWKSFDDGRSFGNGTQIWGKITLPIDFSFNYDNTNISTIYVYGDGWLSFNSQKNPSETPSFAKYTRMISWYCEELITMDDLSYKFEGTAPYRKLTIQHLGAKSRKDHTKNYFEAQIILYETSNEITIVYGENSGIGRKGADGSIYFVGSSTGEYINVRPESPFVGSTFYYSNNKSEWLNKDTRDWIYSGRAWTLSPEPTIASVYPLAGSVLVRGVKYTGDNRPYIRINRAASQENIKFSYQISGPVGSPNEQVIYRGVSDDQATDTWMTPAPQPEGNAYKIYIDHANELCGILADGTLDLETNKDQIIGGKYRITVVIEMENGVQRTYNSDFTIALQNDLEVVEIIYPVEKTESIYPYNKIAPVEVKLKNLGNRDLTKFEVVVTIENITSKSTKILKEIFDSSIPPTKPLKRGEVFFARNFDLTFVPDEIGDYKVTVTTKILDAAGDDDLSNNNFPLDDETYLFTVGYDYEGEVSELQGVNTIDGEYVGNPVSIGVELKNNGSIDLSGNMLYMDVVDPSGKVVKQYKMLINNIPSRYSNAKKFFFDEPFFPKDAGTYTLKMNFDVDGDVILSNNKRTFTFTVNGGLSGKYSISRFGGDFATINDAVTALYTRGVAGPVEFIFQDTEYNEGDLLANRPAVDMSSKIVGVDAINTVTFKIDEDDALAEVVTVNLYSFIGVGVYFGQTAEPSNVKAPVHYVEDSKQNEFAKSLGYITIDGSKDRLLKFVIHSASSDREVFYMGTGAQNITVKNVIMEDNLIAYNCEIPSVRYNSGVDKFEFEPNTNLTTGVLIRNIPPMDSKFNVNYFGLDTLLIENIVIENNIISGFGVGITTLGIGALVENATGNFNSYYNENNKILNNVIFDVSKAGIFVGYEKDLTVKGNRIFDVNGECSTIAAGILAGTRLSETPYYDYNNVNLTINSNEISNITAEESIAGIFVGQHQTKISTTGNYYITPAEDENTKIINNIVWDMNPMEDETDVVGIMLTTGIDNNLTPTVPGYFTTNDFIANNTVIIDDNETENAGELFGVAIIASKNPKLYNNAIVMMDELVNVDLINNSAVYYYSVLPRYNKGLISDRNAIQIDGTSSDLFYMTQIDDNGKIVYQGLKDEFITLDQWYHWTKQDANSIVGDVYSNYAIYNNNPDDDDDIVTVETLRITSPTVQRSIINNRGRNLVKEVVQDIDGKIRGNSNERFDIGAVEFFGKAYVKDMELIRISAPGVYKAGEGKFSTNEYIMTTSPVGISVQIRNNSSMSVTSPKIHVKIYHETFKGVFDETKNVVMDYTLTVPSVGSFHSTDVDITGGQNLFVPETYGDWRRTDGSQPFKIPDGMKAMEANVTPLYKIIVTLEDDQNTTNNVIEKTVRFYLKRASLDILVSSKYLKYDIDVDENTNHWDGQLNLDSLRGVFETFGWSTYLSDEQEHDHLDVDIFDRTEWEPRSINYPIYRTLFWTDGHDEDDNGNLNKLSNYDVINMTDFFKSGDNSNKKNFIGSSQEFVRNNAADNTELFNDIFRIKLGEFPSNVAPGENYDGKYITGVSITRDMKYLVSSTKMFGDNPPYPGLDSLVVDNETTIGDVKIAFKYDEHQKDRPEKASYVALDRRIAGTITIAQAYNIILANVDWRHWADPEIYVRAIIDHLEKNGIFIPIELNSFDALATSNGVELNWTTSSEINSNRFEVEKADANGHIAGIFSNIQNIAAAKQSTVIKYYSTIDNNVEVGNTYAYRLKMVDNNGEYEYSDTKFVTVEGTAGNLKVNAIRPNPVSTVSNVEYTISNSMNVTIDIYDMTGKLVQTLIDGIQTSGTHTVAINAANYNSGVFTLVIKAGDNIVTKTINIVK